jgi:hypothetical protein
MCNEHEVPAVRRDQYHTSCVSRCSVPLFMYLRVLPALGKAFAPVKKKNLPGILCHGGIVLCGVENRDIFIEVFTLLGREIFLSIMNGSVTFGSNVQHLSQIYSLHIVFL